MRANPNATELVVLVTDDERSGRDTLTSLLRERAEVGEILEAGSGSAALELVRRKAPQIMFLDIQMPDMTGLNVVSQIEPDNLPQVVFVTAYGDHAVHAFETGAVDYLLKPFSDERFERAFHRAIDRMTQERQSELADRVRRLVEAANAAESAERNGDAVLASDRIALKLGGRTELVDLDEIYWIEGADVYVRVHTGERSFLVREKLETLERELNPTRFLRVHRSAIVNFDRVARIQRDDRSRHEVVLEDGSRVRVSRSGKRVLDHHLNGSG